jgi:hypothetical protein
MNFDDCAQDPDRITVKRGMLTPKRICGIMPPNGKIDTNYE